MISKFHYLKKYIGNIDHPKLAGVNQFFAVSEREIVLAEKRLGYKFPAQIREFYLDIGYGFFGRNFDNSIVQIDWQNRLADPEYIADIKLCGPESGLVKWDVEFADDELPFFEVSDGSMFHVLKPHSKYPNRVYNILDEVIADTFEEFIWKLYYVSPIYYFDKD